MNNHPLVIKIRDLPPPPADTRTLLLKINPREIAYLTALLETYPGYALIRSDDPKKGLIRLWIAPDFYEETLEILKHLNTEMPIEFLDLL